jgi:hypothetical protein
MTRLMLLAATLSLILSACAAAPERTPSSRATTTATPTATAFAPEGERPAEPTEAPRSTVAPTATPLPATATPLPEPSTVPTSEVASGNWTLEKNFNEWQECGGVVITVREFNASSLDFFRDRTKSEPDFTQDTWELVISILGEDTATVGNFLITVENTSDRLMAVYPDQGTIVVGSEQTNLVDYFLLSGEVGGDIYPGVIKEGALVFGLKRTTVGDIKGVKLIIDSAHDEDFNRPCDRDYVFDLDLSDVVPLE